MHYFSQLNSLRKIWTLSPSYLRSHDLFFFFFKERFIYYISQCSNTGKTITLGKAQLYLYNFLPLTSSEFLKPNTDHFM